MRPTCLDCARKHLAQADALMLEYATGDYPTHRWRAVGHMAEAADEVVAEYPHVAERIRDERLKYMESANHFVDIDDLIEFVSSFEPPEPADFSDASTPNQDKPNDY